MCDRCSFEACFFSVETPSRSSVRRAARKHIDKTGHSVRIECAKSTLYARS